MTEHTITKEQYDAMPHEQYAGIDYPVHRFANFIPIADDKDQSALRESIKAIGQVDPIMLFEESILDGRHRYMACRTVGIEPVFTTFKGDEEAALQFVLAKNIARRNLTVSQKLALRSKLLPEIERIRAAAAERQKAGEVGIPGSQGRTAEVVADMIGIGSATLKRAEAVERAAREFPESKFLQEMAAKVLDGEIGVKTAYVNVSEELDKLAMKEAKLVDPDKQFAKLKSEVLKAEAAIVNWDVKTVRYDYELAEAINRLSDWLEDAYVRAALMD